MPSANPLQTILVVEDQILIRLNIANYLRECGFHVIEAADAAEAIAVFEANTKVDLVFSDIQMPGELDGFGLARWVRQHHSGVQVVLTSGYVKAAEEAGDLCEDGPVLKKPYDHPLLLDRIRRMLGAAGGGTERSCA